MLMFHKKKLASNIKPVALTIPTQVRARPHVISRAQRPIPSLQFLTFDTSFGTITSERSDSRAESKQLLTKKWSGWVSGSLPACRSAPYRRSSLVCARPPAPCGPWCARPCSCSRWREARDRLAQIPTAEAAATGARAATGRGTRRARCVATSSVPFR